MLEIKRISSKLALDDKLRIKVGKEDEKFKQFYEQSIKKLYEQIKRVKGCIKHKLSNKCNYRAEDFVTMLPNEMTKPTEIYHIYNGGYTSLVEPKCDYSGIDIIVGIPCGPPQVIGRIALRETYMKESKIDGYNAKYIFLTGLPPEPYYAYPIEYLKGESEFFNDMVIFNLINTYHNITLLMMSTYKWIIENHPNIKYFIRSNLDVLFFPKRIKGLLKNNNYDVIAEISRFKLTEIYYPQGAFYIFSMKTIKFIYNQSFYYKPIHRWDDVYYGEIITLNRNKFNIHDMGGNTRQMKWDCNMCNLANNRNYIALHPFFPSSIVLFYNKSF